VTFFNLRKSNKARSNWTVWVLAICFSLITLFGSPLHDHDLDSSHVDLDCISCHLVQSNIGLEDDTPNFSLSTQVNHWVAVASIVLFSAAPSSTSSRAPPAFC